MTPNQSFFELTAADLMCRRILTIPLGLSLRDAAKRLAEMRVHGAPVVDHAGRCVGVLSTADLARWAVNQDSPPQAHPPSCPFQQTIRDPAGEMTVCALPAGACASQKPCTRCEGLNLMRCTEQEYILDDWQIVALESLPEANVEGYMTTGAVTAREDAPITTLARRMSDYSVHRVMIVDEKNCPIGIVSNSDLVNAIAATGLLIEKAQSEAIESAWQSAVGN
jgi:CBS-domain-containing membrane protein